jgi:hypothetical protein
LALSNDNSKLTVYNGNQALAVIQKTLSKALIEEHYNAPKVDMDSITDLFLVSFTTGNSLKMRVVLSVDFR